MTNNNWQPAETCPKEDDVEFLAEVVRDGWKGPVYSIEIISWDDSLVNFRDREYGKVTFKRWMPLPAIGVEKPPTKELTLTESYHNGYKQACKDHENEIRPRILKIQEELQLIHLFFGGR